MEGDSPDFATLDTRQMALKAKLIPMKISLGALLRALVIASSVDLLAPKVPVAGNDMTPDWCLTSWLLVDF